MTAKNASIKALRALLRNPAIPPEAIAQHLRELTGRNDRLIAVIGGSAVEAALERLLRSVMPNDPQTLLDPKGALSTFSAKIELAYALGLTSNDVRRNADYIRDIRNVFAHRVAPTSFKTKEVAAVCRLLVLGKAERRDGAKSDMRRRYLLACIATASSAAVRSFATSAKPKPASLP
jgi:hypothetical protein